MLTCGKSFLISQIIKLKMCYRVHFEGEQNIFNQNIFTTLGHKFSHPHFTGENIEA